MADYNLLVDLMNTDTEQVEVNEDVKQLKETNDEKMSKLDTLFVQKQEKENLMRQLENEIEEVSHKRKLLAFETLLNPLTERVLLHQSIRFLEFFSARGSLKGGILY